MTRGKEKGSDELDSTGSRHSRPAPPRQAGTAGTSGSTRTDGVERIEPEEVLPLMRDVWKVRRWNEYISRPENAKRYPSALEVPVTSGKRVKEAGQPSHQIERDRGIVT